MGNNPFTKLYYSIIFQFENSQITNFFLFHFLDLVTLFPFSYFFVLLSNSGKTRMKVTLADGGEKRERRKKTTEEDERGNEGRRCMTPIT